MEQMDMLAQEGPDRPEEFSGTLERVVFRNEENGWTVFRLRVEGREDPVAVVGSMSSAQPGVRLRVKGRWISHPRFGRQIQMSSCEEELPATEEGIRLFLASGCIKGIGPKWADRIVAHFGASTLDVMDNDPDRMLELPRFGKKRLAAMKESWAEHQGIRELMIFLQPHGVTAGLSVRIYRQYGAQALAVVRENPYRLAMDIHGIGFTTADALARKLGFEEESPLRAEAGVLYTLMRLTEDGHVYYPRNLLVEEASGKLSISPELAEGAIDDLEREERVVIEDLGDHEGVYLSRNHMYESKIAFYMQRLLHSPKSVRFQEPKKLVKRILDAMPMQLAEEQKKAVYTAAASKVMVLTGGPGTGKTTILNAIIKVFQEARARILLAAPTGRAAKRMSEASGMEARTIHRLLEYSPSEDGFNRNENNPLACGLLVVDEASMMDIYLAGHLFHSLPAGCQLVLVGDADQLPSVGPGAVLSELIACGRIPVVRLSKIYRQSSGSRIAANAMLIRNGNLHLEYGSDFQFYECADLRHSADMVETLYLQEAARLGVDNVALLSPFRKRTETGVDALNLRLQEKVNPPDPAKPELTLGKRIFRLGDKVMQVKNFEDVSNGDIGKVTGVDPVGEEPFLTVDFGDGRVKEYAKPDLDRLDLAYAATIHKSQGSEYHTVIVNLQCAHAVMLTRPLLYTAITRAKMRVILVGERKALCMAIRRTDTERRGTQLAARIQEELQKREGN